MRLAALSFVSILLRRALLLIALIGLAACQTLPFPLAKGFRHSPPPLPAPIASDRFLLSDPDQEVVGQLQVVVTTAGDNLINLARRFNLGYEEIVAANPGVSVFAPPPGTRVVLPTRFVLPDAPREGVLINLGTMRLFYFSPPESDGTQQLITHPVGIGREGWSTPIGKARIVRKVAGPTWYPPASVRREHAAKGDPLPASVPPGPDNPLGTHALYLSWRRYLIHGTHKPPGVGMQVSHGCIRMYPEDIIPLYEQATVGTSVHVVNQPMLAGWRDGMLYLDAHPPIEGDNRNWRERVRDVVEAKAAKGKADSDDVAVDWDKVDQLAAEPRGLPVPVLVGAPNLDTVLARTQVVENTVPAEANYREAQDNRSAGTVSLTKLASD